MDFLSNFFKSKFGKIFAYVYVAAIILYLVFFLFRIKEDQSFDSLEREIRNERLARMIDSLNFQIQSQRNLLKDLRTLNQDSSIKDKNLALDLKTRMDSISERVAKIDDVTISLRQAINPIKPDEILTITRLKDEVANLKAQNDNLEKRLDDKFQNLSATVLNKAESSDKATNLVILVLAPIVLNFIYTIWKDYRDDKSKKEKKEER